MPVFTCKFTFYVYLFYIRCKNSKIFTYIILSWYVSRYRTLEETTSSCLGGDNLLGLKITEKDANVTVGDVIVGRKSGAFLGKVSIKYQSLTLSTSEFVFGAS